MTARVLAFRSLTLSSIMATLIWIGLNLSQLLDHDQWNELYLKNVQRRIIDFQMAPRCKVLLQDAIAVVKLNIDYFRTGEMPKHSDGIWEKMSKDLKGAWSADCVRTNVKNDRRKILSIAREQMGIILQHEQDCNNNFESETERCDLEDSSRSDDSDNSSIRPRNSNNTIKHMVLTEEEWSRIKPVDTESKLKLQPNVWTNVVADALWLQFRMACAFMFKRAEVRKSPDDLSYFIKFDGRCKSKACGNTIKGTAEKKIDEEGVTFALDMRDTRSEKHEDVKRPLNGNKRREAYKTLMSKGCAKYRKSEARKMMLPGDVAPPVIPNSEVLRQAKKEGNDIDLGIDRSTPRDVVRSIEDMSLSPQYSGLIHEVSGYPFRVLYGSPAQLRVYQEFRRLNRSNCTISIDATGSLVNKIQRRNGTKSGHIFLYAIVINFGGTTACVYQMLSERHDSVTIMTWLFRWLQSGSLPPKQVVCDYSRALLMSASMAFNKQPIKGYINDRFRAISSSSGVLETPVTFIRIDVAHFIHMVCRWKCFQSVKQRAIKDFFLRCVALMVECRTRESFERIFVLTCAVAVQPHEDAMIDLDEASTPKDARKMLESFISKGKITDYSKESDVINDRDTPFCRKFVDEDNNCESEPELNMESEEESCIGGCIESLLARAREIRITGENLNPFYLPDFIDRFSAVAKEFPIWTAVGMPTDMQRATSSYIEGYFNDLKTRVLEQYKLPIAVDKFMREQSNDIAGANCIISGAMVQYNNDRLHDKNVEAATEEDNDRRVVEATEEYNDRRVFENTEEDNDRVVEATCEVEERKELVAVRNIKARKKVDTAWQIKKRKEVEAAHEFEDRKQVKAARKVKAQKQIVEEETELNENIACFVDVPVENAEQLIDSDLFACENWRGKGDALEFNNDQEITNVDESSCDIPAESPSSADRNNADLSEFESKSHLDHTYCQEITYEEFESVLNQRVDLESTKIQIKEQLTSKQPAKTSKYFKPYAEICQQNALVTDKKKTQVKKAALLQNGSLCRAVVMEGRTYFLRNTCAFDSLIHVLATAAIDDIEYREFVQNSMNSTLKFVNKFITQGVTTTLYVERVRILCRFFKPEPQGVISEKASSWNIDAVSNINKVCEDTLSSDPSIVDIEECSGCGMRTITRTTITPSHKVLNNKGFRALQEALGFWSPYYNITCRFRCPGKYTRTSIPSEHLLIELDIRHPDDVKKTLQCTLEDFPNVMRLQSTKYRLAGVIERLPGHYIAHCLRTGGFWQKFNDLDKKPGKSSSKSRIEPHFAIYIRTAEQY